MSTKTYLLRPLFRDFITKSEKGQREKYPGKKLTKGTIRQYEFVDQLLEEYENLDGAPIRLLVYKGTSTRILGQEKRYWQRFLRQFLDFLYSRKKHHDSYVAAVLKTIRACINYIIQDKHLPVVSFHKSFKVKAPSIEPVILSPQQLQFLIHDRPFSERLSPRLARTKDLFVFGCTVGLRYSDLMALERKHLIPTDQGYSLNIRTQKTGTPVQIPLPPYLIDIIKRYKSPRNRYLLPRLSSTNVNLQVKELCIEAGWDHPLPKLRHRRGRVVEQRTADGGTQTFAGQVTAHTMRRTAITTLLIMGVPELAVRRISGHAPGSKEFYKYVVIAQDYVNQHLTHAFSKLSNPN
ncbi:hypothetical protein EPD60_07540 [Flaviaesturariibacter flavus]|uniref:Tyr recombinase domain-containing protein n=1 Tax=Flaviaesturariibacter flavus TaxID=2502780 RepID=A0A4R1BH39_9BACT|nr:tyrosine-type recombinase/integrase [Flaviaesturariibacter flavus]TCJ16585.1 hypothetical protein EPD60_07540 [Flaviaesturariibacter flavus]